MHLWSREWIKFLLKKTGANHILYNMKTPLEICRDRFAQSKADDKMPAKHFEILVKRIDPPQPSEGFSIRDIEFSQ